MVRKNPCVPVLTTRQELGKLIAGHDATTRAVAEAQRTGKIQKQYFSVQEHRKRYACRKEVVHVPLTSHVVVPPRWRVTVTPGTTQDAIHVIDGRFEPDVVYEEQQSHPRQRGLSGREFRDLRSVYRHCRQAYTEGEMPREEWRVFLRGYRRALHAHRS